jgi:hypothetical protein
MERRGSAAWILVAGLVATSADSGTAIGNERVRFLFFMQGANCEHDVEPKVPWLEQANANEPAEEIVWRFRNRCTTAQSVRLCVYENRQLVTNAFQTCDPVAHDIGRQIPLAASGGRAQTKCKARTAGKYLKVVLTGTEAASPCPNVHTLRGTKEEIRTHSLDIVVLP